MKWSKLVAQIREKWIYWKAPYVWKKKPAQEISVLIYKKERPFSEKEPQVIDPVVRSSYIHSNTTWNHEEYIKEIKDNHFIDPFSGFLIDESGVIIQDSIIIDHYALYPDKLLYNKNKKRNVTQLNEVILFDYQKSSNYFHFFTDVLGKLLMIKKHLPQHAKLPLLISEKQYNQKHFQFFKQSKEVANFNWYVHKPDEIIQTQKAFLLQPMPYDAAYWSWIRTLVKPYLKPMDARKKIFISRPAHTGRHIKNTHEIDKLFTKFGYEIVYFENKTIEEQIGLLSNASKIAAIHGAALTNILFCHPGASVLEIMPDDRISSHYYWMSDVLQLNYECVLGDKIVYNRLLYPKGKFYLEPKTLEKYLELIEAK